jgi:predicted O-methyltransferase YrrM
LSAGFWSIRLHAERSHIPIITRDTEEFLKVFILGARPVRILEIGTAIGYSACFMAALASGIHVDSLEKNPAALAEAEEHIRDLGFEGRIRLFSGDALKLLQPQGRDSALEGPYDLVFVDGAKSRYRQLFDLVLPLVAPGGAVLCDNVLMRGTVADDAFDPLGKHRTSIRNMRNFLEYLMQHDAVDTALLPVGDGLCVSILKDR